MKKTENFQIAGMAAYKDNIEQLAEHNPDYDLSEKELIDTGRIGERIYETLYHPEEITLKDQEEEQPDSPARLIVCADGEPVGTILSRQSGVLRRLMQENRFRNIKMTMQGGPYKILLPDMDDTITTERDTAGMYAYISVDYEDESSDSLPEEDAQSSYSFISTTYETSILQEDPGKRGRACLVFALLLSGTYLVFSGLYWWFIRNGRLQPLLQLGGDLPDRFLYPHLGIAAAGFLFLILSVLTKNGWFPMLAALLFTGSCYTLPGYAVFLCMPAFFCAVGALRRRENKALTALKVLALLAVLGVSGWFLKDTALNLIRTREFAFLPTRGYVPPAGGSEESFPEDDEDYYNDEDYDEEDYGGEDYGEDDFDEEDYGDEDYGGDDFDEEDYGDEDYGDDAGNDGEF